MNIKNSSDNQKVLGVLFQVRFAMMNMNGGSIKVLGVSTSGINPVIRIERHENCEQFIRSDKSSYLAFGNKRHGYDKHMHRGCWRAFRIHLLEGLNLSLKDKYLHYIKRAERRRSPLASFQCPKCCETIKTLGAPKGFVELKA